MGKKKRQTTRASISAPWGQQQQASGRPKTVRSFIERRSRLHGDYIRIQEEQKTKRISLILSVTLAIIAGLVLIFAPEGRQVLATIMGVVFLVAAAGLAGYKRLWFRTQYIELDTSDSAVEANDK